MGSPIKISDQEILDLYKKYEGSINKICEKHPTSNRRVVRVLYENGIYRRQHIIKKREELKKTR